MTDIPISAALPTGFSATPDHICLTIGAASTPVSLAFEYFTGQIFAAEADAHAFMLTRPATAKPTLGEEPLDIVLNGDSWVYIGFHELVNMRFSDTVPAFDLKKFPALRYGGIMHYDAAGQGSVTPIPDCVYARFAVKVKPPIGTTQYHDLVDYNIDLIQDVSPGSPSPTGRLPVIFDPGVRYPGAQLIPEPI
ncbi:hypothetical protein [Sphingomonas sanxanigenens]|uniref:Uncharacterized protein n=1 Tax=Sphingomonas sanxanigenens DSM 19645 = NX02 TaxID=1123269 RepID=W0A5Q7_9SPHN|nr:hypothetical protein [Sphingomonas sanxanigenens]AHE52391.1 hypothetical protein NX02_03185 [Sphingomonas sanxanigenens DSM 19645 = NX02]